MKSRTKSRLLAAVACGCLLLAALLQLNADNGGGWVLALLFLASAVSALVAGLRPKPRGREVS